MVHPVFKRFIPPWRLLRFSSPHQDPELLSFLPDQQWPGWGERREGWFFSADCVSLAGESAVHGEGANG